MDTQPLNSRHIHADTLLPSCLKDERKTATDPVDNEFLLRQMFCQNTKQAFTLLFRRYYPNLINQAVRFVYSKEVAEDIVADVFTAFWQERTFEQCVAGITMPMGSL